MREQPGWGAAVAAAQQADGASRDAAADTLRGRLLHKPDLGPRRRQWRHDGRALRRLHSDNSARQLGSPPAGKRWGRGGGVLAGRGSRAAPLHLAQ